MRNIKSIDVVLFLATLLLVHSFFRLNVFNLAFDENQTFYLRIIAAILVLIPSLFIKLSLKERERFHKVESQSKQLIP